MNDTELDVLLLEPLPERDAGEFSVVLMERIAQHQARPARIAAWITTALLFLTIAGAGVFGAMLLGHRVSASVMFAVPAALTLLTFALSFAVLGASRDA